jgi:hypothetical protein
MYSNAPPLLNAQRPDNTMTCDTRKACRTAFTVEQRRSTTNWNASVSELLTKDNAQSNEHCVELTNGLYIVADGGHDACNVQSVAAAVCHELHDLIIPLWCWLNA